MAVVSGALKKVKSMGTAQSMAIVGAGLGGIGSAYQQQQNGERTNLLKVAAGAAAGGTAGFAMFGGMGRKNWFAQTTLGGAAGGYMGYQRDEDPFSMATGAVLGAGLTRAAFGGAAYYRGAAHEARRLGRAQLVQDIKGVHASQSIRQRKAALEKSVARGSVSDEQLVKRKKEIRDTVRQKVNELSEARGGFFDSIIEPNMQRIHEAGMSNMLTRNIDGGSYAASLAAKDKRQQAARQRRYDKQQAREEKRRAREEAAKKRGGGSEPPDGGGAASGGDQQEPRRSLARRIFGLDAMV